ncbi:MAG TPA: PilZ domain-containing protein [bacterium]|nr:PilZ domain-containing protein [bacterium]
MVHRPERRQHARIPADYQYFITVEGRTRTGRTRDVTPFGVSILSESALSPGLELDVKLFIPDVNLKIEARGEVVYCIEDPHQTESSARYLAGIKVVEGTLEDLSLIDPKKRISRHTPSHTITINADAKRCYELLAEFERYPEWAGGVLEAQVIDTLPDGRGRRVEFVHNFFLRKVNYVLDYVYDDQAKILSWVSAGGDEDILNISGNYAFVSKGPNLTAATYELYITLSIIPSKYLVQYVTNILMLKEMKNFKNFVEKNAR